MGMYCEKMMMIGWRNAWSMKLRAVDQGVDQRGPGERLSERTKTRKLNKEDAVDRCKWRKVLKAVRWSGWVSGWVFLLVPAYPSSPGTKAVKRLLLLFQLQWAKLLDWRLCPWTSLVPRSPRYLHSPQSCCNDPLWIFGWLCMWT